METTTPVHSKVTPKDFFLWLGAIVSLYWSVVAFIFLTFDYINYTFPNPLAYYPRDPYQSGISYEMASIIVLLPIYLLLVWLIRKDIVKDSSRKEIWVRRWALILTLFVAAIAVAGDLITLLTTFFNGEELTTAFLLKIAIIFLIAAAVFMHFIADLKGYWDMFPKRRNSVGIAVAVLAVVTIVAGFFIVGTPSQARLARLDDQRISDLQNIQWQVVNYWQQKQVLPATLATLADPISNYIVPVDPLTGSAYEYTSTAPRTFSLCAVFGKEDSRSQVQTNGATRPETEPVQQKDTALDSWAHTAGHQCFVRTIDPELYPPSPKVVPVK